MGEPTQVQNQLPDRGRLAIDFKLLARKDEDFKSIWQKSSGHLNFQDPGTCQALTKAILKTKFGLQLDIPDDRLCPPVPVRWDYVTWVQALVESTRGDYLDIAEEKSSQANQEILDEDDNKTTPQPEKKEGRKITGLDIGTGASAIYTLLLLATRPSWRMCATDTDKKSFDYAARNLALNNMLTRTTLLQTTPSMPLMPLPSLLGTHDDNEYLDFTICNPPFFADDAEMAASLKGEGKAAAPNAVCTGSVSEMVCEGGDLGFVKRMVEESFVLRGKVGWYTSMLGKLASAKAIVEMLKEKGVRNWAVGCLEPGVVAGGGGGTKRWAVGWSFGERRPRNDIARTEFIAHEFLPFPTQFKVPVPPSYTSSITAANSSRTQFMDSLPAHLSSLDLIHWRWNPNTATGVGEAAQNVWNRAYRREQQRRKRERADDDAVMHEDIKDKPVALAFRIHVPDAEAAVEAEAAVVIDWLRGRDVQLWESFTGMVKRYVDGLKDKVEEGKEDVGMPVEGKGRVLGGAKEGGSVIPGLNRTRF